MSEKTSGRTSPKRILDILDLVISDPKNYDAKKISLELKIPLATVYRHLDTLCEEKFLIFAQHSTYIPGPKIREIILKSVTYEPEVTLRRSFLRQLTNEIQETVSLSMPLGTKLIYFDRIEYNWPMQLNLDAGDQLPLHASASGKLYLANMDKKSALKIFENIKKNKNTKNTITDVVQFEEEIKKIKNSGHAFDDEEWFAGMVGVSIPIKNKKNELCFCLSTHTAKSRKNLADLKKIIPSIKRVALSLEDVLLKN